MSETAFFNGDICRDCSPEIPNPGIHAAFKDWKSRDEHLPITWFWDWKSGLELCNWLKKSWEIIIIRNNNYFFTVLFPTARIADRCRAYVCLFYSFILGLVRNRYPMGCKSLQYCTHSYSACIMAVNPIFSARCDNPGRIPEFWDYIIFSPEFEDWQKQSSRIAMPRNM